MSDKLPLFPIPPKVKGCLFTAPGSRELCKQGVAVFTFSSWHNERPQDPSLAP